jgi:hypothetical protein
LTSLREARGALVDDYEQAAQNYAVAQSPAEKEAAAEQIASIDARSRQLDATQSALYQAGAEEVAAYDAETKAEVIRQGAEEQLAALDDLNQMREQRAAARAERRDIEQQAREDYAQRSDDYRAALERDPDEREATTYSALHIVGELLTAYAERRTPDISGVVNALQARTARERSRKIADAKALMGMARDDLRFEAEITSQVEADMRAEEAARLEQLDLELQRIQVQHQGTPRGVAAEMARGEVRQQQAIAEQKAHLASQKAAAGEIKLRAEVEKTAAETELTRAKTAKTVSEIRPRQGKSPAAKKAATLIVDPALADLPADVRKDIETKGIRDPVSGRWLRTQSGGYALVSDKSERQDLEDVGSSVTTYDRNMTRLAELVNTHGWEHAQWPSEARQEMNALFADSLAIANSANKLGALDNGTTEVLRDSIGGGVQPGEFGAQAATLLDASKRMRDAYQRRVRTATRSGTPVPVAFPRLSLPAGAAERGAEAAGAEATKASVEAGVIRPKPSTYDPEAVASTADQEAAIYRRSVSASNEALTRATDPTFTAVNPGLASMRLADLARKIKAGQATREERDRFETMARQQGVLATRDFVAPAAVEATKRLAADSEARADAERAAAYAIREGTDPTQLNLRSLRSRGVIRYTGSAEHPKFKAYYKAALDRLAQ